MKKIEPWKNWTFIVSYWAVALLIQGGQEANLFRGFDNLLAPSPRFVVAQPAPQNPPVVQTPEPTSNIPPPVANIQSQPVEVVETPVLYFPLQSAPVVRQIKMEPRVMPAPSPPPTEVKVRTIESDEAERNRAASESSAEKTPPTSIPDSDKPQVAATEPAPEKPKPEKTHPFRDFFHSIAVPMKQIFSPPREDRFGQLPTEPDRSEYQERRNQNTNSYERVEHQDAQRPVPSRPLGKKH